MSPGLPFQSLGISLGEVLTGNLLPFRLCGGRNSGSKHCPIFHKEVHEWRWPKLQVSFRAREEDYQLVVVCKVAEKPRDCVGFVTGIGGGALSRACSSCSRTPQHHLCVHSKFYYNVPHKLEWCLSGQPPAETSYSTRCSPTFTECRSEADRHISVEGSSSSAVRCDMDSSDQGKEEIMWAKESVTTASSALAQWRSARTRRGQDIVDWGRYHLQVMFVDRSHRARARLAEGLFERIAAWNGFGLILYGHSCGISAKEGDLPSMSYQGEGQRLGVARHVFKSPSTTLDRSDLDSYDLIVAMDIEVRDEVLRLAASGPSYDNCYANKVRLISEFATYGVSTTSLLEDSLLEMIQPDLPQARAALEVQPTYMSQYSKWRVMVATITMCCAGLIQFLMDAYPDDLPDYDPVD